MQCTIVNSIKKEIKDAFIKDVDKSVLLIDSLLLESSSQIKDFLLLKKRITTLRDESNRGTLSFDEIQKVNNQITISFIYFIDKLNLDDFHLNKVNQFLNDGKINTKESYKNGSKESTVSFNYLKTSTKPEIYETIEFYKHNLNKGNLDDEIYFSLGLCYLHLKIFDLAKKNIKKALELAPDNSEYHFYLSIANIRNRRPFTLMPNDIRSIEKYINSALEINNTKGKYYILLIILKYDYYFLNGLKVPTPSIDELIKVLSSKEVDPFEIQRLKDLVPISDSKLNQFVNQF